MKNFLKIVPLLVLACLIFSCSNDNLETQEPSNGVDLVRNSKAIDLNGFIVTRDNKPVDNVTVRIGNEVVATSRADGSFSLEGSGVNVGDVLVFENSGYVTVTKIMSEDTKLIISMLERAEPIQIDPRRTNSIAVGKEGRVVIPANSLGLNGEPYSGPINVQATLVDVRDPFQLRSAPGSYTAMGNEGAVPLTSFGMIEVVATIPGERIRLDVVEGASVQMAFPILLPRETPETVNLYSFNTSKGLWVLEGELVNTGSVLLGEVTSIDSSWNADEPCAEELICVKVKVIFTNGNPGCGVAAEGLTYQGFDGINTIGADDYVYLDVCPDSVFELQSCFPLCIPCPGPVYTTTIDLTTITTPPGPDGCIDLGTWTIVN